MGHKWKPDSTKPLHMSYEEKNPQAYLFTDSCGQNGDILPHTETWHVALDDIEQELLELKLFEIGHSRNDIDEMHTEIYNMGVGEVKTFDISLDSYRTLIVTKII